MAIFYRQKKKYSKPRKLFDKVRIDEENILLKRYGLKNKREVWRADAIVRKLRERAKDLITASTQEQQKFISRLVEKGFLKKDSQIDDVLDLKKESILERRLQTIVFKKVFAKTVKGARQLIIHRHIILGDHIVDIPSYNVDLKEENNIKLREKVKKEKKEVVENA